LTLGLVCVELGIHKIPDGPVVLGPLGIVGRLDQVGAHRVDGVWYFRGTLGGPILEILAPRRDQRARLVQRGLLDGLAEQVATDDSSLDGFEPRAGRRLRLAYERRQGGGQGQSVTRLPVVQRHPPPEGAALVLLDVDGARFNSMVCAGYRVAPRCSCRVPNEASWVDCRPQTKALR